MHTSHAIHRAGKGEMGMESAPPNTTQVCMYHRALNKVSVCVLMVCGTRRQTLVISHYFTNNFCQIMYLFKRKS